MASNTYRIDSGFLDDYYGYGTITPSRRRHNSSFELTIADPIIEPATVQMVKDHYNINHDDNDAQLRRNIKTAFRDIEDFINRSIVTRQHTVRYKRTSDVIVLPRPPHGAISSIKSIDDEGTETTFTLNTDYYVIGDKEKVLQIEAGEELQIEIIYEAGYGKGLDDIPSPLQDAVIFQLGVLYSNFDENMGTTVYDREARLDERAISACKGFIFHLEN